MIPLGVYLVRHYIFDEKFVWLDLDVILFGHIRSSQLLFGPQYHQLVVFDRSSSIIRFFRLVDLWLVVLFCGWRMEAVRILLEVVVDEGRVIHRWLYNVL